MVKCPLERDYRTTEVPGNTIPALFFSLFREPMCLIRRKILGHAFDQSLFKRKGAMNDGSRHGLEQMFARGLICDEELDEAEVLSSESCANQAAHDAVMNPLAQSMDAELCAIDEEEADKAGEEPPNQELSDEEEAFYTPHDKPHAGKAPFSAYSGFFRQESEPDLVVYFSQFLDLPEVSQIAICRTYANYLAAKQKRLKPQKKRQRQLVFSSPN